MKGRSVAIAFGKVLRETRERSHISQEELAAAAGLDRTYVSMLERGVRQPTIETLFRLASALDVTPSSLISKTSTELN